jgi:hypothetical protein
MKKSLIFYTETCAADIKYVTEFSDEVKTMPYKDKYNYRHYRALGKIGNSDEALQEFRRETLKECNELKNVKYQSLRNNKIYSLNYLNAAAHKDKIYLFFYDVCPDIIYSRFKHVQNEEYILCNETHNGGLTTIDESYINIPTQVYSYDFSSFYPNMMIHKDFKLPCKAGRYKNIELEKHIDIYNLPYGFYNVTISFNEKGKDLLPSIFKIFSFKPTGQVMTHYSLIALARYLEQFGNAFTFELNNFPNNEYNAYIYNEQDLIDGKDIFGEWFRILSNTKKQYPKNKILKHLFSSLWGTLTEHNNIYVKYDKIHEYDATFLNQTQYNSEYKILDETNFGYELLKLSKPYKYPFGRLVPFLSSFCRSFMSNYIIKNELEDSVIAVCVDRISFKDEYDFPKKGYHPKFESKSSGNIKFTSKTRYINLD